MSEVKEVKKDDRVTKLETVVAAQGRIQAKMKKKLEEILGLDIDGDGKVGKVSIALLGIVCVLLIVGSAFAATIWNLDNAARTGDCNVTHDGTAYTLTVDNIAAAAAGDITTDDINMSGAVGDTLGFNVTKAASVTGLAATVKIDVGGTPIDTDYVNHILLQMDNDSAESVDWAYLYTVIDDNTTNTEDSAVELYIQANGTATKALDIDRTAVDCGILQINATGADLGDGALANVGAITADSIDADAAGGFAIGSTTATSIRLGATNAHTVVLGGLKLAYVLKTANYTNTVNDCVITYDTSAATTNTLPEASTVLGSLFTICLQDDDGDLVVMTDGTDKFDGTNDILTFADAADSCTVMATAANVYTILVNVGGTLSN